MKTAILALALTATLAACGSETDADDDVTGQDETTSQSPDTTGEWPEFEPESYTFVYSRSCRCPDAATKIEVTVVDGKPTGATYAENGRGFKKGDPAESVIHKITIDDLIDEANSEDADVVEVDWPEGQDYPTSVFVDQDERGVDDEITFTIHSVQVSP